jgi:hypothetical protein
LNYASDPLDLGTLVTSDSVDSTLEISGIHVLLVPRQRISRTAEYTTTSAPLEGVIINPVSVVCVRFGQKYQKDYVVKLRNMVQRHLTVPYEFFCLTDDPSPTDSVVNILMPDKGYSRPWWHKIHLFDPSLGMQGRIIYFDLDVIIHDNINKLISAAGDDFYGIRDFNRKFNSSWRYLNSSVMSWQSGKESHIWSKFINNNSVTARFAGDQDWIWHLNHKNIKFWPDSWIQSYKWEIRSRNDLESYKGRRRFKDIKNELAVDPECSVAVFHGDPKPDDIEDKFVLDNWQ